MNGRSVGQDTDLVVVVDCGMGNVGSVVNALKKIGAGVRVSESPRDVLEAGRLVLPGVGAFDAGMANLEENGYLEVLQEKVVKGGTPILGICLGMQLLTEGSEEGERRGLGWLKARTVAFRRKPGQARLKIPHMGWNYVQVDKPSWLFGYPVEGERFYFVHSYHVDCFNADEVIAWTEYGSRFASAVCRGNICGVQFHPEKSHRFGLEVFRRFVAWAPGGVCGG